MYISCYFSGLQSKEKNLKQFLFKDTKETWYGITFGEPGMNKNWGVEIVHVKISI